MSLRISMLTTPIPAPTIFDEIYDPEITRTDNSCNDEVITSDIGSSLNEDNDIARNTNVIVTFSSLQDGVVDERVPTVLSTDSVVQASPEEVTQTLCSSRIRRQRKRIRENKKYSCFVLDGEDAEEYYYEPLEWIPGEISLPRRKKIVAVLPQLPASRPSAELRLPSQEAPLTTMNYVKKSKPVKKKLAFRTCESDSMESSDANKDNPAESQILSRPNSVSPIVNSGPPSLLDLLKMITMSAEMVRQSESVRGMSRNSLRTSNSSYVIISMQGPLSALEAIRSLPAYYFAQKIPTGFNPKPNSNSNQLSGCVPSSFVMPYRDAYIVITCKMPDATSDLKFTFMKNIGLRKSRILVESTSCISSFFPTYFDSCTDLLTAVEPSSKTPILVQPSSLKQKAGWKESSPPSSVSLPTNVHSTHTTHPSDVGMPFGAMTIYTRILSNNSTVSNFKYKQKRNLRLEVSVSLYTPGEHEQEPTNQSTANSSPAPVWSVTSSSLFHLHTQRGTHLK